jgi:protein-S-isoprenylcysteine O-methyltransferase Ste14
MTGMDARRSPIWYRLRPAVFGSIYGIGFFGGNLFDISRGVAPVPVIAVLGLRLGGERGETVLLWLAVAAIVLAWAARVWGSAYLRAGTVWNADALDDTLIVAGPFRFVRNPLYSATILLAVGFGLFAPPLGCAIVVVGNIAFVCALISVETPLLRSRYGETFDRFVAAVPALVLRFTPANVAGATVVEPSYASGFRSEIFFAAFALGAIALGIGGAAALPIFYVLAIVGYVARVVLTRRERAIRMNR